MLMHYSFDEYEINLRREKPPGVKSPLRGTLGGETTRRVVGNSSRGACTGGIIHIPAHSTLRHLDWDSAPSIQRQPLAMIYIIHLSVKNCG